MSLHEKIRETSHSTSDGEMLSISVTVNAGD